MAYKKTTTRKSTTNRRPRKTSSRKKKSNNDTLAWFISRLPQISGLIAVILTILAIAKVGLIGKLVANLIRLLVGGSYQLLLLVLLVPFLVVMAYGTWPPRLKWHHYLGFTLFYVGIMLIGSILLFNKMNLHSDYVATIQQLINQDLNNHAVTTPVGGGIIGAIIYQYTYLTMSNFGSWLIAIVLLIVGTVIMFRLPLRGVFDNFFSFAEGAGDLVQTQATTAHEKVTESINTFRTKQKDRQQEAMNEFFNEEPFSPRKGKKEKPLPEASSSGEVHFNKKQSLTDDDSEAIVTKFVVPEIVAPTSQHEQQATMSVDSTLMKSSEASRVPKTVNRTKNVSASVAPSASQKATTNFDSQRVIQSADPVEPVVYGEDLADDELLPGQDVPLSHVDILDRAEKEAANKVTHHANRHVTPSAMTEPTPDVDASGLGTIISDKNYRLPTTQLLQHIGSTDQSQERDALSEKARILHQTLQSFKINATVEKVVLGPTVTQYEIKPAVGVKVSKIQNLADDLALALAAKSLRIEAPIPGKNVVGIEVANDQQATVGFRDMVEEAGVDTDKPLIVPIGRGVTSGVVKVDLTKMPHLLIAGSTGSGKSVAINGILASILLQAKPSQVRLMLVDPKKVELSVYNDIPHLITPVVSDPKKAALGLKKVVAEMDRRFKLLAEEGVRNIDGYNKLVAKRDETEKGVVSQKMPYLVVIIDELADLMMTSAVSGDVENAIVRIAQLGRAAGIHMIVATQRPSVDIITGLIKANVPSRMAFAVSSGVDSRTILDGNGAEKLLGRGDMLFAPIGSNGPQRVQGAFISDDDVAAITDFIKQQGSAQYDESMSVSDAEVQALENGNNSGTDELDEKWDEVLEFILRAGGASTSSIQRHFGMGYNRAGRIIDSLEDRGLIGPANGSKPRELKFTPEMMDRFKKNAQ
ncbi:DNA translocase FtsK [Weissella paramesenteroides]|uniref:DNA translocase FtsK n=1 Tax=Weissella paramesenteroides TaxID=1249 RepID=UPI003F748FC0